MASPAATKYKSLASRATIILKPNRRGLGRDEVQVIYGAAFVSHVAAWNAYFVELVACFFQEIAKPAVADFHALHTLADAAAKLQLDRFNTPNAENTRNLIVRCTGYDPWMNWQWAARGMNALTVQGRLNEILKVRHSIAHGSSMRGFGWNQAASGEIRLTLKNVIFTRTFLNHLVATTDAGLKTHLTATYGVVPRW